MTDAALSSQITAFERCLLERDHELAESVEELVVHATEECAAVLSA